MTREARRANPLAAVLDDASTRALRVLFCSHPTVGHTAPLRTIGAEFLRRGHRAAFVLPKLELPFVSRLAAPIRAAAELPAMIERDGFELLHARPSLATLWHASRLASKSGYEELRTAVDLFTSGAADHARTIATHVRRWNADVVVSDYLLPSALLAARLEARPFCAVYHTALPFADESAPPFGSGLSERDRGSVAWSDAAKLLASVRARFDDRVESAARELGLREAPTGWLSRPISDTLNILATTPELEPSLPELDATVLMTGPLFVATKQSAADDAFLAEIPAEGFDVYVSLGTVFNDKPDVYATILDGIERAGLSAIVSAGNSYGAIAKRQTDRVRVFARVPQVALLSRVKCVVTHGGNNTVQECLAAAKPMVVVPFGTDQIENARRVERLGVGVAVMSHELSAQRIEQAVRRARGDERAIDRGQRIAASLRAAGGVTSAADAIEHAIRSGAHTKPLC